MRLNFTDTYRQTIFFSAKFLLIAAFTLSSAGIKNSFALEKFPVKLKSIRVAQETFQNNGIHVSRPKPLDLKILDIIDLNKIRSLEDYSIWLEKNIHYQTDGLRDLWAAPKQTLNSKLGDCEDFSFLNIYVLQMLGYKPKFIAVQRPGKAHAISVFKNNGRYYWFDNARLHKSSFSSLEKFAKHMTQKYNYLQFLELDLRTNTWSLIYEKSPPSKS